MVIQVSILLVILGISINLHDSNFTDRQNLFHKYTAIIVLGGVYCKSVNIISHRISHYFCIIKNCIILIIKRSSLKYNIYLKNVSILAYVMIFLILLAASINIISPFYL